jgi:hypothetical protein
VYRPLQFHERSHFGKDLVFIDIDEINPGEDWVEVLKHKLDICDIIIVAIGPHWLGATDASGKRRLDNKKDFVRMEIVAGLGRKVFVIPVLVGGAQMPPEEELPEALAPLSRRNAIEVSETRFDADVNRLIKAIEKFAERDAAIQCRSGFYYQHGARGRKNLKKARELYQKAADQGDKTAIKALAELSRDGK